MGRHRDFWGLTEDGLVWASKSLQLDLTADRKKQLMDAYLQLAAFPDVKPGLEALKRQGIRLAILSNGEPKMLEAAAKSAGILARQVGQRLAEPQRHYGRGRDPNDIFGDRDRQMEFALNWGELDGNA
jgi:hypothetical protein